MKVILTSGKRKTAIARAMIKEGKGRVKVNNVPIEIMTPELARIKMLEPLLLAGEDKVKKVDLNVDVHGGGFMAQAEAVRISIARGLTRWYKDSKLKKSLLEYDRTMLVGDARRAEPKKFGGHAARARKQKSYR
nr:30S ribosomal protein S9 [Candidatus Njordarchaeota archaeon]